MAMHAHALAAGLAVLPEDSLPEVVRGALDAVLVLPGDPQLTGSGCP